MAAWKECVPCVVHTIHGLAFHPYQATWRNAIYIAAERAAARRCHRILCVADALHDTLRHRKQLRRRVHRRVEERLCSGGQAMAF